MPNFDMLLLGCNMGVYVCGFVANARREGVCIDGVVYCEIPNSYAYAMDVWPSAPDLAVSEVIDAAA
jgi:hypothetical protein